MNILVTGATGFIGKSLVAHILEEGNQVYAWVRDKHKAFRIFQNKINCVTSLEQLNDVSIDAVINLAGEPIIDKRWTKKRKSELRESRVELTNELVSYFLHRSQKPSVLLSGSAIGYYGSQEAEVSLREDSGYVEGYTHELCDEWEQAALKLSSKETRVCLLRTGIVLGNGGALQKMLLPFKLGLGGPVGNGKQIMSWVHISDWIQSVLFVLNDDNIAGPVNIVAPNPVSNKKFSKELAKILHRPAVMPMPCLFLRGLMGESSELLCKGQNVSPARLLEHGYEFIYHDIVGALQNVLKDKKV